MAVYGRIAAPNPVVELRSYRCRKNVRSCSSALNEHVDPIARADFELAPCGGDMHRRTRPDRWHLPISSRGASASEIRLELPQQRNDGGPPRVAVRQPYECALAAQLTLRLSLRRGPGGLLLRSLLPRGPFLGGLLGGLLRGRLGGSRGGAAAVTGGTRADGPRSARAFNRFKAYSNVTSSAEVPRGSEALVAPSVT